MLRGPQGRFGAGAWSGLWRARNLRAKRVCGAFLSHATGAGKKGDRRRRLLRVGALAERARAQGTERGAAGRAEG
jgi:hypothetical protein